MRRLNQARAMQGLGRGGGFFERSDAVDRSEEGREVLNGVQVCKVRSVCGLSFRRIRMYVCMYVCMYVRTYVCMYVRTYVRMYVCIYVYMYIFICMYVCMSACMHACMHACM